MADASRRNKLKIVAGLLLVLIAAVWGEGIARGAVIVSTLLGGFFQGLAALSLVDAWLGKRRFTVMHWLAAAALVSCPIVLWFTPWWRLYVVSLGVAFSVVLIDTFPRLVDEFRDARK